ncbi:MAG: TIR domain-containing protein [Steroidobacteraceae bacterium]
MSEIFISYARSTANVAQAVAEALRALGYGVWWDDQLPAHRNYADVIEERLRSAKAVVVIWSAEAAKSQWVRAEADLAREAGTLVQLNIDGVILPMPFNQIQCADLAKWCGEAEHPGWRKIVSSVDELIAGAAPVLAATDPVRRKPDGPLLAVLAFDNLSGDPEMAYFSDGVSQEILDTVARGSDLKVIARSSSFQFRGPGKAVRKVAAALRATHLLDGSVRRAGAHVRISAQLVECASEITLWSHRFDRALDDVFALQDEIALAVAEALKTTFTPATAVGRIDPVVYERYLKAKDQGLGAQNLGLSLTERALLLEQVIAAAPQFAAGWAWLGQMRALLARAAERGTPFKRKRAEALDALDKAIALDPQLPTPYIALTQLEPEGAFARRWRHVLKSLAVAPDHADSLTLAGHFSFTVGWAGDALAYGRRAYELDPLHPMAAQGYASAVWVCGDTDRARQLLLGFREKRPADVGLNLNLVNLAIFSRDWSAFDDAVAFARANGHVADRLMRQALAFGQAVRSGDSAQPSFLLQMVERELGQTGTAPLQLLNALCELGHNDEVFDAVERASFAQIFDDEGGHAAGHYNPGIILNRCSNWPMMSDPRFVRLCHKLRYIDFWLESGRWPDFAEKVPYDFKGEARRLVSANL